jgi:hypothetical protein
MVQEPFDHNAPTHAQVSDQRAREQKAKEEKQRKIDMRRTIGIWFFGIIASAMVGGIICEIIIPYPQQSQQGLIAGPAIFACVRLLLAERRQRVATIPAPPIRLG